MQITPVNVKQNTPSFGSAAGTANKILHGSTSKIAKAIEFDGLDMSFPVLLSVMLGGVLLPRVIQAQDKYDREEIIRRDSITIATMAFGAKMLSKGFSKFNEIKSGFALASKGEGFKNKSIAGKIFDYLRPVKGINVLNSEQLVSKYSNLETYKDGINGFCEFIDKEGGNLKKVFGFVPETKEILEKLVGKEAFASADNNTIKSAIKKAQEEAPDQIENLLKQFRNTKDVSGKTVYNKFVQKAKSMNSTFGFLSMVLLVPVFLGFVLPKVNETITKKKFKARNNESAQNNSSIQQNSGFMSVPENNKSKAIFNEFNKITK